MFLCVGLWILDLDRILIVQFLLSVVLYVFCIMTKTRFESQIIRKGLFLTDFDDLRIY